MTDPIMDETAVLKSRTGTGIKLFLETKTKSHEIAPATSGAMLTAVKKMLEVDPALESADVLTLDTDDLFERFRIKNAGLTDQSFAAYKSRFKRATTMYQRWLDGESWRPSSSKNGGKKPTANAGPKKVPSASTSLDPSPPSDSERLRPTLAGLGGDSGDLAVDLFPYRVFLEDSKVTVTLQLPPTYTARDAAKLTGLINALASHDHTA